MRSGFADTPTRSPRFETGSSVDATRGARRLFKREWCALFAAILALAILAPAAGAATVGPIDFESPSYTVGNIDGQNGWSKSGPYDAAVASVGSFPDAAGYGFGAQALRSSNAVVTGAF